ncbi:GNAT family N-acetyltransferase [soil metagenome]
MFTPGTIIAEFTSKKGKNIVFRLAYGSEIEQLTNYINELSREDTFVTFSGEEISLKSEREFLERMVEKAGKGDGFVMLGYENDTLVAVGDIERLEKRSRHVGSIGVSVKKGYREEGIGATLLRSMLEIAQRMGFKMIQLSVYEPNTLARGLYTALGFEEVGKIPKKILFHGELVDEIVMVKFL